MSSAHRFRGRACLLSLILTAIAAAVPTPLAAQEPSAALAESTVLDLPLSAARRRPYLGVYSIQTPDPPAPALTLRVFERRDTLMGSIGDNDPTRLLYQGDDVFRPAQAPAFVLTFTLRDGRAAGLSIDSPDGPMHGVRVSGQPRYDEYGAEIDRSASGPLYEELARMDRALFRAAYVTCDTDELDSMLTADTEFYHDRDGFRSGQQVRDSFARLVAACPRERGVTRELVEGSLRVYPIAGYGAVQTGEHRFLERGSSVHTVARFVHLWRRSEDGWRLARALSFDHHREPNDPSGAER